MVAGGRAGFDGRRDRAATHQNGVAGLARGVGFDPAPLMAAASTQGVLAAYEANTEEAIRRSVFGSPTYFVDGDMFYGQDHLEMLERALERPFAGPWPRP